MNYYKNSDIAAVMVGLIPDGVLTQAERFMESRTPEGLTSETEFKYWLSVAMSATTSPLSPSLALELFARVTKLQTHTPFTDLYDLPQEIVVKFWKNLEEHVRKLHDTASKHTHIDMVLAQDSADRRIRAGFTWSETPEGEDYWYKVYRKAENGEYLKTNFSS